MPPITLKWRWHTENVRFGKFRYTTAIRFLDGLRTGDELQCCSTGVQVRNHADRKTPLLHLAAADRHHAVSQQHVCSKSSRGADYRPAPESRYYRLVHLCQL